MQRSSSSPSAALSAPSADSQGPARPRLSGRPGPLTGRFRRSIGAFLLAFLLLEPLAAQPAAGAFGSTWAQAEAEGSLVSWRPWNAATVQQARSEGRNVYVFVGIETAELSRTTLTQIFGRKETADWLNENFLCVLVDASVQPGVAAFAHHYVTTVKQARGWPVHVWLTPEFRPYDGAGYLPATEEWGRPGFLKSARTALDQWREDPAGARALAEEAEERMRPAPVERPAPGAVEALLTRATAAWLAAVDPVNGGFGTAPKEPEPEVIRFLLGRGEAGRAAALQAARAVVAGGLHDRSGGGFFRRTLDAGWTEPQRQKSMLDQARLALALFAVADAAGEPSLRAAGESALAFVWRELRRPEGAWASWWDASGRDAEPVLRGEARAAELGVLALALHRSADPAHRQRAGELARSLAAALAGSGSQTAPTIHDLLATRAAAQTVLGRETAGRLEAKIASAPFDPQAGTYLSVQAEGVPFPPPVLPEPFLAEGFALLHGLAEAPEATGALRARLWWDFEYAPLPPGEALLALSAGL